MSDRHVLTAAHCLEKGKSTQIRYGSADLTKNGVIVNVSSYAIHPMYSDPKAYYDVAVLYLQQAVRFSDDAAPICVPDAYSDDADDLEGRMVTLTGWGVSSRGEFKASDVLKRATLSVYSQRYCSSLYPTRGSTSYARDAAKILPFAFQSNVLCAGYEVSLNGLSFPL